MTQARRPQTRRNVVRLLGVTALILLILGLRGDLDGALDRLTGADDPPMPVAILQEGTIADGETRRTWTIDLSPDQMLIVDAHAVVLVREDEGSRIDNVNPDRILLAAEGGHPYTLTIEDGRWAVVAGQDGRAEFCSRDRLRDGDWGVRYMPASWGSDPC